MCDDYWDSTEATVVCRQLGYVGGSVRMSAYFGQGAGPIMLDDVSCNGKETTILACSHKKYGKNNCRHYEDVGVVCYGETSKGNYMDCDNVIGITLSYGHVILKQ